MAYDTFLADRIRRILAEKKINFEEKKMMGGWCVMVNDKMLAGIAGNQLMARVGKENHEASLKQPGVSPMDFTGRVLSGFVYVDPQHIDQEKDLIKWIDSCLEYNPKAKSSKKRK